MSSASTLRDALTGITSRISADMSERDVENAFLDEDFFDTLGYEGSGRDVRSEWTLSDSRRPDYVTLDANESVTAVYEFKTTGRDLGPHTDQLFGYVEELKAEYGVLTNGEQLRLYRRNGDISRLLDVRLSEVGDSEARDLQGALQKPTWDITDPESVQSYLDRLDPVSLDGDLGREHFFDTFRLEEDSPFADLVTASMDLLRELRDEEEAKFVKGAYDFWEASYASEPNETPDSWEPFIGGAQSLRDFMFCLESGHALLARLLLAKACEDHDFFPQNWGLQGYFNELQGFSDRIDLDAYPVAINGLMEDMREQLVESLFEDDIFVWWTEAYQEELSRGHANSYNLFREVAQEGSDISKVSRATRERFSRAVARVSFSVLKFDFSRIEGDPLGDLYQRYFDPETRKALGEFYTPQPVIDYILDSVEYERGVSSERLIDPSCGSGTFLVEAVNRYLDDVRRYNDDPDWEDELVDLCSRPNIVGLDVHPFAVLMAQIRFMVAILPEYREAKRENPEFTIRRLPIFRTDTLRNERESTGIDLGESGQRQMTFDAMTEDGQDVKIPVPLPVEVDDEEDVEQEGDFLVKRVRMPLFDTIQLNTGVSNFGEYFAALQGVLDVVKAHMNNPEFGYEYVGGLERAIGRYTTREYDDIEEFFIPYVNDILGTVRYLKEEHGDGRLFKMFEDSVLALVVKNYMDYEYVVGNPPYVNIKNIPDDNLNLYKSLYESAFGRFDLYVLFLERGLHLLSESGKLGFITSNKFAKSKYGKEIRRIISSEFTLEKYIDFGDTGVFEDAVNYPCILTISRNHTQPIHYAKIRKNITNPLIEINHQLGDTEYITESMEISTYPQSELGEGNWRFTPRKIREIASSLDQQAELNLGDIALGVREGVASGGDNAFIVNPNYAEENGLEDDLLLPIIRGRNVRRWQIKWNEELAIYPYNSDGNLVNLSDYPNIRHHLDSHEEYLKDRYCVQKGEKGIYEYHGPHAKSVYEGHFKIATPDMATENQFSFTNGFNCYKNTVYVLTFPKDIEYSEKELLGILNSSISEFIVKQNSPYVNSKYFRYKTQYVNPIPIPESGQGIEKIVDKILYSEDLQQNIDAFPNPYLESFDGELEYVNYEWETNRKPVEADVRELEDNQIIVTAGRTDKISSSAIDRGSSEESKFRAEYIHAAVDGQNVRKGERQRIPIPRKTSDVEDIYRKLEQDKAELSDISVSELEAKIDTILYEMFDLSQEEQKAIEEYIQIFK